MFLSCTIASINRKSIKGKVHETVSQNKIPKLRNCIDDADDIVNKIKVTHLEVPKQTDIHISNPKTRQAIIAAVQKANPSLTNQDVSHLRLSPSLPDGRNLIQGKYVTENLVILDKRYVTTKFIYVKKVNPNIEK